MTRIPLLLIVLAMLFLSGCNEAPEPVRGRQNWSWNMSGRIPEPGPCGSLLIKRPLFNVTYTVPVDSSVAGGRLHILPNRSREAAVYAVYECAPIGDVNLSGDVNFSLALPVGDYVMAYRSWDNATIRLEPGSPHVAYLFRSNESGLQWLAFGVKR